jgi:hypothetical protein
MEVSIVESLNFFGGREENHRYWNTPVLDRDVDQAALDYRLEAFPVKPNS